MQCYFVFFQQPTEQNTYSDIEAVYRCLEEKYGVKEQDVILYGQSVGSGPTLELASRLSNPRAVVLHSAIASGVRVMYPVKRTYWFDIYKANITSPCPFSFLDFGYYFCSNMVLAVAEYREDIFCQMSGSCNSRAYHLMSISVFSFL